MPPTRSPSTSAAARRAHGIAKSMVEAVEGMAVRVLSGQRVNREALVEALRTTRIFNGSVDAELEKFAELDEMVVQLRAWLSAAGGPTDTAPDPPER